MKKVVPLEGFGGGGTPLNFKIVAYATEEELLAATPKENTIGVITSVPITGYKFSATEPEDMVEGEVWICVGSDSTVAFDVVEGVKTYPLSTKQYISGAWINKVAMSYQNGEWKPWLLHIFKDGVQHIKFIATNGKPTISITNDKKIRFVHTNSADGYETAQTEEAIDLTNWTLLTFDGLEMSAANGDVTFLLIDKEGSSPAYKWIGQSEMSTTSTVEIDISNISGENYVAVKLGRWAYNSTIVNCSSITIS